MSLAQILWLILLNTILLTYNIAMQLNNKDSSGTRCFGRGFCVGVTSLMITLLISGVFR